MDYERLYKKTKNYFGVNPETILKKNYHMIDRKAPVLDIGAGQGRHSLFLAKRDYEVDAIEPVGSSCELINDVAVSKSLSIKSYSEKFNTFHTTRDFYSGVLVFGVIQNLKWSEIKQLLSKLDIWTQQGSVIFITCWSVNDPALIQNIDKWKKLDRNSYENTDGGVFTFLEKDEILDLFDGYECCHHWEGLGPIHRHGNSAPERHGRIEAIFRKNHN